MSTILYYSNFCEHSKKLLQHVSKSKITKDIHFICIDKRVKESNGKIFIVLQNGQKIVMPPNITKVPALYFINQNNVLYGNDIYNFLKPKEEVIVKHVTQNNMEPMAFGFTSNMTGIVSDSYSFWDLKDDALETKGNGGLSQLHNYVLLDESNMASFNCPTDEHQYNKFKDDDAKSILENLERQRNMDVNNINYRKM
jgi:hypothetical protein